MLYTIENYKKLFLSQVKAQFNNGESASKSSVEDKNKNGTSLDDLLKAYKSDGKLDKNELWELWEELENVENQTKEALKTFLVEMYTIMLEDGVDIKDKSELDGLVKKLKKVGIEVSISSAVQKKSNNWGSFAVYWEVKDGKISLERERFWNGWRIDNNYVSSYEFRKSQNKETIESAIDTDIKEDYKNLKIAKVPEWMVVAVQPEKIKDIEKASQKELVNSKKEILLFNKNVYKANLGTIEQYILKANKKASLDPFKDNIWDIENLNTQLSKIGEQWIDISGIKQKIEERESQINKEIDALELDRSSVESRVNVFVVDSYQSLTNLESDKIEVEQSIDDFNKKADLYGLDSIEWFSEDFLNKYEQRKKVLEDLRDQRKAEKLQEKYDSAKQFYSRATSGEIKKLQTALNISADGVFGKQTFKAIADYQAANNLSIDGKAGNATLNLLLGTNAKDFYKGKQEAAAKAAKSKKETQKEWLKETLKVSSLKELKNVLSQKQLVASNDEYYYIPKNTDVKKNVNELKHTIETEQDEQILSLEEILIAVKNIPKVELAIEREVWINFFDRRLNEAEKLTLITSIIDKKEKEVEIYDLDSGKIIKEWILPNEFGEIDLPKTELSEEQLKGKVVATITIENGLFTGLPKDIKTIQPDAVYKLIKGKQEVSISGTKLLSLIGWNDGYENRTLWKDKRKQNYSDSYESYYKLKKERAEKKQAEAQKKKEETKEKKQETKEQVKSSIEKQLEAQTFGIEELLGKKFDKINPDSQEYKWLSKFPVADLVNDTISLNGIKVDVENKVVKFEFDDSFSNDSVNKNLEVKINPNKFSLEAFRKDVIKEAKRVSKIKEEPKKKTDQKISEKKEK